MQAEQNLPAGDRDSEQVYCCGDYRGEHVKPSRHLQYGCAGLLSDYMTQRPES